MEEVGYDEDRKPALIEALLSLQAKTRTASRFPAPNINRSYAVVVLSYDSRTTVVLVNLAVHDIRHVVLRLYTTHEDLVSDAHRSAVGPPYLFVDRCTLKSDLPTGRLNFIEASNSYLCVYPSPESFGRGGKGACQTSSTSPTRLSVVLDIGCTGFSKLKAFGEINCSCPIFGVTGVEEESRASNKK